ncbi:MAG: energy-coupling factor ABC transporter permease [Ahrensia sp.]
MHIEPGIVDPAKMGLAYATAAVAGGLTVKMAWDTIKNDGGVIGLFSRSAIATVFVLVFFELLPHFSVGVSEVHFILGSTLLLMLGTGPAAIGLMGGLLLQGLFFAPSDLPMLLVNVTTLVIPAFAIAEVAKRIIAPGTAYKDVTYKQALALSTTYQAGIVAWVAFWAFYGQGFGVASSVASFGAAYMMVVLIEPVLDLAVLAGAKALGQAKSDKLFTRRLHGAAA